MIGDPLSAGTVHDNSTCWFPGVADSDALSGTAAGVAVTGSDAGPSPLLLVAVTVKVYSVPLVSPSTVHDVAAGVQVPSGGETVTV